MTTVTNNNEFYTLLAVGDAIQAEQLHEMNAGREYGALMVRVTTNAVVFAYNYVHNGFHREKLNRSDMFKSLTKLQIKGLIDYEIIDGGDVGIGFTNKGMAQYFWNKDLLKE